MRLDLLLVERGLFETPRAGAARADGGSGRGRRAARRQGGHRGRRSTRASKSRGRASRSSRAPAASWRRRSTTSRRPRRPRLPRRRRRHRRASPTACCSAVRMRVYALDVGRGQLHASLRADPRVVVLEGRNARHLDAAEVPEPIGLVTIDVSFISLRLVVPAVVGVPGRRRRPGGADQAAVRGAARLGGEGRHPARRGRCAARWSAERARDPARRSGSSCAASSTRRWPAPAAIARRSRICGGRERVMSAAEQQTLHARRDRHQDRQPGGDLGRGRALRVAAPARHHRGARRAHASRARPTTARPTTSRRATTWWSCSAATAR